MNKKQMKFFAGITAVLCVLLFMERLTGALVHVILGFVLAAVSLKHVFKKMALMKHMPSLIQWTDAVILTALVVVIVSGMLLHPLGNAFWLVIAHKLSGMVFFLGTMAHAAEHYKLKEQRAQKNKQ